MKLPLSQRFTHKNSTVARLRIAVAGILLSGAAGMALIAASGPESLSESDSVLASFVPRGLSTATTTVVVQLSGKSVAESQADAGRKLTTSEKNQIKSQLKGNQDSLKPQIQA